MSHQEQLPIRSAEGSNNGSAATSTSPEETNVEKQQDGDLGISTRGKANLKLGERMQSLVSILGNIYDKERNPNGTISLGVAENSLMHDELAKYYNEKVVIKPQDLTYLSGPFGTKDFLEALAKLLNTRFSPPPLSPVQSSQIIVQAGVSSALDALGFALTDDGDGFLLSRPLYTGFKGDLELRNKIKLVPVSLEGMDPMSPETVERYETELLRQKSLGVKIRGIIMCNPHNPVGRCYSKEAIIAYMKFCSKHNIHYISDEIYALSTFTSKYSPNATPFISALSIPLEGVIAPHLVHILYGMSKDFSSNGLRVGALITQNNPHVIAAAGSVSVFGWTSNLSQLAGKTLLNDEPFLDWFLAENSKRLGESYDFLVEWLDQRKISYLKGGNAGFFLWVDFSPYLSILKGKDQGSESSSTPIETKIKEDSADHEVAAQDPHLQKVHAQFFDELIKAGLYIGNSESFFSERYGWFRVSFSVEREIFEMGLERLDTVLNKIGKGEDQPSPEVEKARDPAKDLPV